MIKKLILIFFLAFLTTFAYGNSTLISNELSPTPAPSDIAVRPPLISPEPASTPIPTSTQKPEASPSDNDSETKVGPTPSPELSPTPKPKPTPAPTTAGGPNVKTAYLTIDDGPSGNTMKILDILSKYDVKATFFVNGREGGNYENLYKEIVKRGHTIGNHTYSHDYAYIYSSVENFMKDYDKLNSYIFKLTGVTPQVMRFPGGSNNQVSWRYSGRNFMKEKLIPSVLNKGYTYFDWNVSLGDSDTTLAPAETLINNVKKQLGNKPSAVILLHDLQPKVTTPEALPRIIEYIKSKGYNFKTLTKNSPICRFQ